MLVRTSKLQQTGEFEALLKEHTTILHNLSLLNHMQKKLYWSKENLKYHKKTNNSNLIE